MFCFLLGLIESRSKITRITPLFTGPGITKRKIPAKYFSFNDIQGGINYLKPYFGSDEQSFNKVCRLFDSHFIDYSSSEFVWAPMSINKGSIRQTAYYVVYQLHENNQYSLTIEIGTIVGKVQGREKIKGSSIIRSVDPTEAEVKLLVTKAAELRNQYARELCGEYALIEDYSSKKK